MNKSYMSAILAVTALAFSDSAMAIDKSNSEYNATKKQISADYKSAQKECDVLVDNAKNICLAKTKRIRNSANSKLTARHETHKNLNNKMSTSKAPIETPKTNTTETMEHLRRP